MPKISVIIPTYNMAPYLVAAIESILAQTHGDHEIIVVDDGSTDNSNEVLVPFLDRIVLLKQANSGPAKARNLGIRRASGEFVAFLDADDIWYPKKMEKQLKVFQENPNYAMVHSNALIKSTDNSQPEQLWFTIKNRVRAGSIFSELLSQCFIIPSSVIVKKECLEKTGMFDENLWCWEGYDLWLRLAYEYSIGFIRRPLIERRLHDTNLFYSDPLRDIISLIAIMQKWAAIASNLPQGDRATIKRNLQYNYFRLGRYYLATGHIPKARKALRASVYSDFSLLALVYFPLSLAPNSCIKLVRRIKRRLGFVAKQQHRI